MISGGQFCRTCQLIERQVKFLERRVIFKRGNFACKQVSGMISGGQFRRTRQLIVLQPELLERRVAFK